MRSSAGGAQVIFLLLLLVGFYLLVLRPQRRRVRQAQSVQQSVQVGAEVVTTGGLHGRVAAVDGGLLRLEVAPGVEVSCEAGAVVRVLAPTPDADPDAPPGARPDEAGSSSP